MFLKVSCWPKLTSFFYACVYPFDSSSYSNQFFAMLVTTEKTRTFLEALVFFSVRHSLWHFVLVCAFSRHMINNEAFYNLYNILYHCGFFQIA